MGPIFIEDLFCGLTLKSSDWIRLVTHVSLGSETHVTIMCLSHMSSLPFMPILLPTITKSHAVSVYRFDLLLYFYVYMPHGIMVAF